MLFERLSRLLDFNRVSTVPGELVSSRSLGWPVIVDVQNVADYVNATEIAGRTYADLCPGAISPWRRAWLEWHPRPDALISPTVGALVDARSVDDDRIAMAAVFLAFSKSDELMLCGTSEWWSDRSGESVPVDLSSRAVLPDGSHPESAHGPIFWHREGVDLSGPQTRLVEGFTYVAMLTFSFANCRNVSISDCTVPQTRRQRRHGPPATTYKVLDIAPMQRVLRDEGGVDHNGLQRALHICRGHFARYTAERPLFGRHEGLFWHPMHVRGSAERGVAIRDYKVVASDREKQGGETS